MSQKDMLPKMLLVRVRINPDGDGCTGLYGPFGILIAGGDEYHDSISAYIDGYVDALSNYHEVKVENWTLPSDHPETYNINWMPHDILDLPIEGMEKP